MSFWDVFVDESLQKPWVIRPRRDESVGFEEPTNQRIFITPPGRSDDQLTMMTKMVVALKLNPEDVSFVELDPEEVQAVEAWESPKKVMFFGNHYPGDFGSTLNYVGHQVIKTHGVVELENNPGLKRETWAHLQLFGSLK